MKVLTIGMDGAGYDVFNRGWTPKIASLLEKSSLYRPKNDLISRGWVEIASGEHGLVTGALYDYPHCNGTYEWSTEYSLSHMKKYAPGRKWFWSALNEIGFRTGILNLPTTFPAPAINGFIVSGGGGGAPVISTPTKELIFPKEILPLLKTTGYIVDERLYQLVLDQNIKDASGILERLKNKNQKRVDSLLSLYEFDPVDLGFITFKTSSVMVETLIQVDLFKMENGANYDNDLINEARKYYGHFDSLVDKLVSDIQPECVIFISDHGMTRTTHKFNPNIMLQNLGYQKILAADQSKRKLHSYLRKLVPSRIKRSIKSILKAKNISIAPVFFDARATSAFCRTFGDWRSGIYINDSARFKGQSLAI